MTRPHPGTVEPDGDLIVAVDDPAAADVAGLLARHLSFAYEVTQPGHVHALDADRLRDPAVTFFSMRRRGDLVGVGALRHLDDDHAEVKSMHVSVGERGRGFARLLVEHLLAIAAERGYRRVSLETGTGADFEPARRLYASVGFEPCASFAEYTANPHSTCMTIALRPAG